MVLQRREKNFIDLIRKCAESIKHYEKRKKFNKYLIRFYGKEW